MFCYSPEKNNIQLYLNWSLYTTIAFRQDKVQKNSKFSKSNETVDIHAINGKVTKYKYILWIFTQ
jgi:hypothetical protein